MARPRFARGKTVSDRSHQAADHRNERGGDLQPFRASHFFTAHEVRPDVENRERDRDKHSCREDPREPAQQSNGQGLLHLMVQIVLIEALVPSCASQGQTRFAHVSLAWVNAPGSNQSSSEALKARFNESRLQRLRFLVSKSWVGAPSLC